MNNCIDCGGVVSRKGTPRCKSCWGKTRRGESHPLFGKKAWNKGLTVETDERVAQYVNNCDHSIATRKMIDARRGSKASEETRKRISLGHIGLMVGEKNGRWLGGKSFEIYPLGWRNSFKEQIRNRDGYKCQICGVPEIECNRKLCVHHIDYNKQNIKEDNLISLCITCHTKTNHKREEWKSFFEERKCQKIQQS